jgi:hypothetical protein
VDVPLSDYAPEDVIRPEHFEEYKRRRYSVHERLLGLRTSIFTLRKLSDFPLRLFASPPYNFWRTIEGGLLEACITRAWQLACEQQGERYGSLTQLRAFVMRQASRAGLRGAIRSALKGAKFSDVTTDILSRVANLRNAVVAHFDGTLPPDELKKIQLSSIQELEGMCTDLEKVFDLLCFGYGLATLPGRYLGTVGNQPTPTDIDTTLLAVAEASTLLRAPEREPAVWAAVYRPTLDARDLADLNQWRAKVRLPPVQ